MSTVTPTDEHASSLDSSEQGNVCDMCLIAQAGTAMLLLSKQKTECQHALSIGTSGMLRPKAARLLMPSRLTNRPQ